MRSRILFAFCALLLMPTGCAEKDDRPPPGPTPAPASAACAGSVPFFPDGPAYAGKGPHKLVAQWFGGYDSARVARPSYLTIPEEWIASNIGSKFILFSELTIADWQLAELVLCVSGPVAHFDRPGGKCGPYQPGGKNGYYQNTVDATYDFRLLEARTGRLRKEFSLQGTEESCPGDLYLRTPALARVPSDKALADQLRPLVATSAG
jgi:hypothetical protein